MQMEGTRAEAVADNTVRPVVEDRPGSCDLKFAIRIKGNQRR